MQSHSQGTSDGVSLNFSVYMDCKIDDSISKLQPAKYKERTRPSVQSKAVKRGKVQYASTNDKILEKKSGQHSMLTSFGRSKHTPHLRVFLQFFISSWSLCIAVSPVSELNSATLLFNSLRSSSSFFLWLLGVEKFHLSEKRDLICRKAKQIISKMKGKRNVFRKGLR